MALMHICLLTATVHAFMTPPLTSTITAGQSTGLKRKRRRAILGKPAIMIKLLIDLHSSCVHLILRGCVAVRGALCLLTSLPSQHTSSRRRPTAAVHAASRTWSASSGFQLLA